MAAADDSYWTLLESLWRKGEEFVLIEQDIEISKGTLKSFRECSEPWCTRSYHGPGYGLPGACTCPGECASVISGSLGCVRFRPEIMETVPDLLSRIAPAWAQRNWRGLDSRILAALRDFGLYPHVHHAGIYHHHRYHGVCACGRDHEEYQVDAEGRYKKGTA